MCELVRCTVRRTAPWRPMRTRVLAARRFLDAFLSMSGPLLLLRFFERDLLAGVAHALALVRLGRLVGADLGGHLPDLLLVDALDHDLGLRRRLGLHAVRKRVDDGVREAER